MAACNAVLSQLPEDFHLLPVEEAIEILAVNRTVDSTTYFRCKRKQEDEARWIMSQ